MSRSNNPDVCIPSPKPKPIHVPELMKATSLLHSFRISSQSQLPQLLSCVRIILNRVSRSAPSVANFLRICCLRCRSYFFTSNSTCLFLINELGVTLTRSHCKRDFPKSFGITTLPRGQSEGLSTPVPRTVSQASKSTPMAVILTSSGSTSTQVSMLHVH